MTQEQLAKMGPKAREVNFRQKLETSRAWAERALVVLHDYQTQSERDAYQTIDHNEVGFNSFDAPLLSQLAEKVKREEPLNSWELNMAFRRVPKYAKQLVQVAMQREAA